MTEHQTGLRFDIYERVYLDETSAPIGELDEMELIPHIQVVQENEQAVLQGNLWLTGKYTGENGEESCTLEHFIPVEITLPMNRIQRLEDITVEIETFDVDLLSSRSVNVTGVLSLHGIEMISRADETWKEEEEFQVVHQADESAPQLTEEVRQDQTVEKLLETPGSVQPPARTPGFGDLSADRQFRPSAPPFPWSRSQEANEASSEESQAASRRVSDPFRAIEQGTWGQSESEANASAADTSAGDASPFDPFSITASSDSSAASETLTAGHSAISREEVKPPAVEAQEAPFVEKKEQEPANEKQEAEELPQAEAEAKAETKAEVKAEVLAEEQETVDVVIPPDKQELKIAFKPAEPTQSYHLTNLVGKLDVTEEAGGHRAEEKPSEPAASAAPADNEPLEFRRLVSSSANGEEKQFKRMRMCIVQKEETLETIAERYNLNPREIVLYNRLGDQQLEEGQVIYIP
ncbi:LysM peptidoglycan-binding domain-containing protein [Paenibacillus senegalensis]|uniref:LysM peptidoglycan-binding domain-containing protein n=1 Tax=Paenibacillus senegalensis TaxID=1465766 RepID=UPI000288C5E0|nr:LysM peptidoglycan-binding domain-containing protein [Paenibacillus senegalensis]